MIKIHNYPFVSIALATYNGEKYLYEQLESIANQTYKNFELVITDDSSSDKTIEIIEHFRSRLNIKLLIHESNLGVIKNFENAISLCKGNYIALSDQDDIWESEKIEKLLKEIKNYDLISSDALIINEWGEKVADSWIDYNLIEIPSKKNQFKKIAFQNFALGCTMLFRRELIERIIPIPLKAVGHDWWIALVASLNGKIKFLDDKLVKKRIHKDNVSVMCNDSFWYRFIRYFSIKARQKKKIHYESSVIRLQYYLDNQVYNLPEEKKFLQDLLEFYSSYLTNFLHVKSFIVSYRYRYIFYERYSPIARFIHVLAKLIG